MHTYSLTLTSTLFVKNYITILICTADKKKMNVDRLMMI